MKRILYMATTINGLIADEDDKADWVSEAEWNSYSNMVRTTGCMIIGHRTYDILTQQSEFAEFKDVKIVVVARTDATVLSNNHSIARSPQEALDLFQNENAVVIAGGGQLNASFFEQGLFDEVYLDVEPFALGKGVPIFSGKDFIKELELIGIDKLSKNEVQLHYRVIV
ncbi:MAG TPA: dihydrofolate reductase family protein [Verrucomicrobiae bacterium]|nr:dihydrofolate reductase family protein [Verrucomicrobiae bacterium]